MSTTHHSSQIKPIRRLILAASPLGYSRVNYDWELRAIEAASAYPKTNNIILNYTVLAARPRDLQEHLLKIDPHIVHFSAHGTPHSELVMEGSEGVSTTISANAITELFRIFRGNVRLVVFNVCYSDQVAKDVTQYVDFAVGMRGEIGGMAAQDFAEAFYRAIAYGKSIQDAFQCGRHALMLNPLWEEHVPMLYGKEGLNPKEVCLVSSAEHGPCLTQYVEPAPIPRMTHSSQLRYTEGKIVFVGREAELAIMERVLVSDRVSLAAKPKSVCTIQGMAGVGKTWLIEHFFARHKESFEGGIKIISINPAEPMDFSIYLSELARRLDLVPFPEPKQLRGCVVDKMRSSGMALHIENVDSRASAELAARLVKELSNVPTAISGRYMGLGADRHLQWTRIELRPFGEKDALEQLYNEMGETPGLSTSGAEARKLLQGLGYLPLAIRLAGARLGRSPQSWRAERFLERLWINLDPSHQDPAMIEHAEANRVNLSRSFELSFEDFQEAMGEYGVQAVAALGMLAFIPLESFGPSLGMAVSGIENDEIFNRVLEQALTHSLLERLGERRGRYRMHPLVTRWVMKSDVENEAEARFMKWVGARIVKEPVDSQQARWEDLDGEAVEVGEWLRRQAPVEVVVEYLDLGLAYILRSGIKAACLEAGERIASISGKSFSKLLGLMGEIALSIGEVEQAQRYAERKIEVDECHGNRAGVVEGMRLKERLVEARGMRKSERDGG